MPDVRAREFVAEAHRQASVIAFSEHEVEDQAFVDAISGKPGPVVIVQDDRFDATASVTVCPLTTNVVEAPLVRIAAEPTADTGMEQASHIMVDKVVTMPRANVRGQLGRLAEADIDRLDRALLVFLGLAG